MEKKYLILNKKTNKYVSELSEDILKGKTQYKTSAHRWDAIVVAEDTDIAGIEKHLNLNSNDLTLVSAKQEEIDHSLSLEKLKRLNRRLEEVFKRTYNNNQAKFDMISAFKYKAHEYLGIDLSKENINDLVASIGL